MGIARWSRIIAAGLGRLVLISRIAPATHWRGDTRARPIAAAARLDRPARVVGRILCLVVYIPGRVAVARIADPTATKPDVAGINRRTKSKHLRLHLVAQ